MEENIFLFIPNIIGDLFELIRQIVCCHPRSVPTGYARWIFLIVSLYFMPSNQFLGATFYILSGFLDAFDGWTARKFNQGSTKQHTMI